MRTPAHVLQLIQGVRQVVDSVSPAEKQVGLTFYEWNVMWDRSGDTLSGVFAAAMLNLFCREADALGVVMASYFLPVTEGAIAVGPISCELEPDGEVFELYSAHQGNRLIQLSGETDQPIDACASIAADGTSIFVTVINEDTLSAREVELSLLNFVDLHAASAELLVSQTLDVGGDFTRYEQALTIQDGSKVRLGIPRFSVAGVRLTCR